MHRFSLVALIMAASTSALAGSTQDNTSLDVGASFAEQHASIKTRLADGETYSEISSQDRSTVKQALDRIAATLDSAGGVEALTEKQKAEVFNAQEVVNTILTKAKADSRVICRREKKVGSHRETTQCATVAQRRADLESAQDALRKVKPPKLESR